MNKKNYKATRYELMSYSKVNNRLQTSLRKLRDNRYITINGKKF